jgi:putative acetyltransferase
MIRIISYQDQHAARFRELNLQWLEQYGLTESHDLQVLDDPRGTILDRGGVIFLAESEPGMVVGSAALMREGEDGFELAKMAVDPSRQGQGISKSLLAACIQAARDLRAKQVTLYSNHQLTRALGLYRSFGFRDIPLGNSPFETADVRMQLDL